MAVKRVFRYLRQTKDWGLIYWRKEAKDYLPDVPFIKRILDDPNMRFVRPETDIQLSIHDNAEHVADIKTR